MQVGGASGLAQFSIFLVALAVLAGYLTYRDASNRTGANAPLWALAMGVGALAMGVGAVVVFAAYYLLVIQE